MRTFFTFLLAMTLFSCKRDRITEEIIRVNHYQSTADSFVPQLVFLTQEGEAIGTQTWRKFYENIENFDYQPGYIYDLKLTIIHLEEELQDASSVRFVLKEVLSKVKVPDNTKFTVPLKDHYSEFVRKDDSNGNFLILNQILIDCNSMCPELETKLDTVDVLNGIFEHGPGGLYKLVELREITY